MKHTHRSHEDPSYRCDKTGSRHSQNPSYWRVEEPRDRREGRRPERRQLVKSWSLSNHSIIGLVIETIHEIVDEES